jgi:hypothetical protein
LNILFSSKHEYLLNDSLQTVRVNIENMTNKKWSDFSENITGTLNADNTFKLTNKWSFAIIKWFESDPAYLSGTISNIGDKTKLTISTRPNSVLIISFYGITILFLYALFGVKTFINCSRTFQLLFFPFFNLILFGLMQMFTVGLRKRFERIMKIH